jgi:uncharacterized Tic20 family protein
LQVGAIRVGRGTMSAADELDKLKKLHEAGTITDEQYEHARVKLLDREAEDHEEEERKDDRKTRDEEDDEREERRPRHRRRERDELDEEEEDRSPRVPRKKVREWCMLLHLSLLAGHAVALGGIIAPIVIWQVKKDEIPEIDVHGKNAVNWLITWIIYMAVSVALAFVIIGIPLLIVGGIAGVVFPIIAELKANEGKVWKYPLAIAFLK